MSRKKIIIMTVPFGGGHYATAQSMAALLQSYDPTLDVKVSDVITEVWPAYARKSTELYVSSTSSSGGFWYNIYYQLSDKWPYPLQWLVAAVFGRQGRRKFKTEKPDLIIATFPLLGHVAAKARDHYHSNVPIVTVVTDAGDIQGIWLSGHEDFILTATEDTVAYAEKRHLGPAKLKYIGFPVAQEFYERPNMAAVRQSLHLKNMFTVLITAGGLGTHSARVLAIAQELASANTPMQLIFVAGMNEQLHESLKQISFPKHIQTRFYGFTSEMPRLMQSADVVCSKAGWLTINESLAAGKPLLLFDAIPGQEEQNARYVTRNKFGCFEPDPAKLRDFIVSAAASDSQTLQPFQTVIQQRGSQSDVPAKIAAFCIDLIR